MSIGSPSIDIITALLLMLMVNYIYFKYERFMIFSRDKQLICWIIMSIVLAVCGLLILNHI